MRNNETMSYMELAQGLQVDMRVRSAIISDCLDIVGERNQVMIRDIAPLTSSMKSIGYAATIEFVEDDNFDPHDPYGEAIDFLDELKPMDMAVIATGGSIQSAFWGELFSTAAKSRGARGMVTDGSLRDSEEIKKTEFNVFGCGTLPLDYKGRCRVSNKGQAITCGGVIVNPGDLIVADADGVAVVPQKHIAEVVKLANERVQRESKVLSELQEGSSVRDAWNRHRTL